MPPTQSAARALAVTASPTDTISDTDRTPALMPSMREAIGRFGDFRPAIGIAGMAIVGSGVVIAIGGAVWAVLIDVPYPIAIMAGYCTLAGALCLAMALRIASIRERPAAPALKQPATNYAAWRLVNKFSVSDAARLWCDLEPGSNVTQEAIAWARVLFDAISRNELPMIEKTGVKKEAIDIERANPTWHTEVSREALTAWAASHGFNPRFLSASAR